jgi:enoyl-CoA hydratase/carnithine racemase
MPARLSHKASSTAWYPAAHLRRTTMRLATTLCVKSRDALALGKALFYRQLETELEKAYADASATMTRNMLLPAAMTGIEAFIGKRRRA